MLSHFITAAYFFSEVEGAVELLTIEELRRRVEAYKREEQVETVRLDIDKILSPVSLQSKENLMDIIRMLPEYSDEEKETIVEAFEDGIKMIAEDFVRYGAKLGSRGIVLEK